MRCGTIPPPSSWTLKLSSPDSIEPSNDAPVGMRPLPDPLDGLPEPLDPLPEPPPARGPLGAVVGTGTALGCAAAAAASAILPAKADHAGFFVPSKRRRPRKLSLSTAAGSP